MCCRKPTFADETDLMVAARNHGEDAFQKGRWRNAPHSQRGEIRGTDVILKGGCFLSHDLSHGSAAVHLSFSGVCGAGPSSGTSSPPWAELSLAAGRVCSLPPAPPILLITMLLARSNGLFGAAHFGGAGRLIPYLIC